MTRLPNGTSPADFTTRDIAGTTVRLSDHLGRDVILLDFWTTWSKPSRADLVHLQELYVTRHGRGFLVLAVSMDGPETIATVPQVARSYDLTFPVLLDEDTAISSSLNPKKSTPLSMLIDRSGHVVRVREGYNPGDEQLVAADVDALLADRPVP